MLFVARRTAARGAVRGVPWLAAGVAAVTVLAGCSSGTSPDAGASTSSAAASPTASTSASPTAVPVPPAPKQRACYRLGTAQLTVLTNESRPVPCTSRHTAHTIFVGRLQTKIRGRTRAVDSAAVQRQLATTCPRKLAAYVGGSAKTRDLSRFNVIWFSPTLQQVEEGARWFRCDLVAFADGERLLALPRTGTLRGVLGRPDALTTYGLCGTAAPGTPGFERVICQRRHSWHAVDTIELAGGAEYPGSTSVRVAGDGRCKTVARDRASDTLKFTYGWEWPTREQWIAGQHFGYCWVPA